MTQGEQPLTASQPGSIWWVHPSFAFAAPLLLAGATAYFTSPVSFVLHWRTPKYFDFASFALLLAAITAFVLGCLFGSARRDTGTKYPDEWIQTIPWPLVRAAFHLSFFLTISAYAVWSAIAIKNGFRLSILLETLHRSSMAGSSLGVTDLRSQYLTTLPGITTAIQFGIAVIVLGVPLGIARGWQRVRWQMGLVLAFATVRALVNSERLAVIELLVPMIISFLWLRPARHFGTRLLVRFAPVVGGVSLYLFFGAAEYFRSWNSFYAARESSFWSFIGLRLMGYYATALNNGALLWRVAAPSSVHEPLTTLTFFWRFPVIQNIVPVFLPFWSADSESFVDLLTTSANPEFNNPGGAFLPFVDFGVAGGLLYWLVCGIVVGILYAEFKKRSVAGIFLFPALFIALIEASRILYWSEGRAVPSGYLLIFCVLFVFRTRQTRPFLIRAATDERGRGNALQLEQGIVP